MEPIRDDYDSLCHDDDDGDDLGDEMCRSYAGSQSRSVYTTAASPNSRHSSPAG